MLSKIAIFKPPKFQILWLTKTLEVSLSIKFEASHPFLSFCSSGGGGGGSRNFLPPPKSENFCRQLVLSFGVTFQGYILADKMQKYLVKSLGKSQFCIEIFIKKSQYFLTILQNFIQSWSKRRNLCMKDSYLPCPMEIIRQMLITYLEFL